MSDLLGSILNAHGGPRRWSQHGEVEATIASGGALFGLKGQLQDLAPRRMSVALHEQRSSVRPFGAPDQRTSFTPERTAIERDDGTVVAESKAMRASFAGHTLRTACTPLQRAYFNGYALWTYLTTPFLLARPDVEVSETAPYQHGNGQWRVLRAAFPPALQTHSPTQSFYFDDTLSLRRHDYEVDIAGGFGAAQLVHDYVEADGFRMPSKRRAYMRDEAGEPDLERLMVEIDLSSIRYS